MNANWYITTIKDFILDRQFLNLFISTFVLFLASLLAWYIYVSLVLMSLLTTILTPIVLRNWLYRKSFGNVFKRRVTAK